MPRKRRVVLISSNWRERSLIRAQLEFEGYDVTGVPGLVEAIPEIEMLNPDIVVLDTHDQPLEPHLLEQLRDAAGPAPIITLLGRFDARPESYLEAMSQRVLVRPVFIREVVQAVTELGPALNGPHRS